MPWRTRSSSWSTFDVSPSLPRNDCGGATLCWNDIGDESSVPRMRAGAPGKDVPISCKRQFNELVYSQPQTAMSRSETRTLMRGYAHKAGNHLLMDAVQGHLIIRGARRRCKTWLLLLLHRRSTHGRRSPIQSGCISRLNPLWTKKSKIMLQIRCWIA
jgi:hypothetical protein